MKKVLDGQQVKLARDRRASSRGALVHEAFDCCMSRLRDAAALLARSYKPSR